MTMPEQKPGRSRQDIATPPVFLTAVKKRLRIQEFTIDLAANKENRVCPNFFSEYDNALVQTWPRDGWCWLNPPFGNIRPWVGRACYESQLGTSLAMLVPAAVGSNWWAEFVDGRAYVLLLNGRITFVGETAPYPKDCCLLLYGPYVSPGYAVWRWMAPRIEEHDPRIHPPSDYSGITHDLGSDPRL